jgi:predicted TIM-barrel fold metal-dependent hydrolase
MRKRSEVELQERPPLWTRDHSNGEYYHFQTEYERKLERLIMQKADENARKLNMPRRDFLASAMGMCTSLWCVNFASACSSNSTGENTGPSTTTPPRPKVCDAYQIQPDAMFDEQAACAAISGDEFIFDIQTHFFDPNGDWKQTNAGYETVIRLIAGADYGMERYLQVLFCESDTKMAVLSTWPGALCSEAADIAFQQNGGTGPAPCGLPMSTEEAARSRAIINEMANSRRLLNHAMILPNDPQGVEKQMEIMEATACTVGVSAWKLYPAWGPNFVGFYLDDPNVGIPIIEKGLALGVNTFCAHKGLPIPGFDAEHNLPIDVGPVAKNYPKAKFIIYHASIRAGGSTYEGEYVDGDKTGVNALITSMLENGIGPNQNVYAELGSSWRQVMNDSVQAAHYLGKLMKYVGEDNICWGTDSIVGGTPQRQIEALRAMSIPADMQTQYGYPELTQERKEKIFGLNSAAAYGVDPTERHCQINSCQIAKIKKQLDEELGDRRWSFDDQLGLRNYQEYVEHGREMIKRGVPG